MTEPGNTGTDLRASLTRLLPVLLIAAIMLGNGLLCMTAVLPAWRIHQQLSTQVDAGRQRLDQQAGDDSDASVLQQQIASAQATLSGYGDGFLTQPQADGMVDALYAYAQESGAQIASLQSQQAASPKGPPKGAIDSPVYDAHIFRLQATGSVLELLNFVSRIREAAAPGVAITNLNVQSEKGQPRLTMDVVLYTSPYASGKALDGLPTPYAPPTSAPEPTVTPVPTEPPLALIFTDSFENDTRYMWKLGAGWSQNSVDGNRALRVENSTAPLTFLYTPLLDSAVQARFKLESGTARLSLRSSDAGNYTVTFDSSGKLTLYRGDAPVQSANTVPVGESWHTLRLSAVRGIIRASMDGAEVIAASENAALPPGAMSFALIGGGPLWVDDVQVFTLNG